MAGQKVNLQPGDKFSLASINRVNQQGGNPQVDPNLLEIPKRSKEIECAGCGRLITVADRVCMAYCASCSADQGKKK